jgi:hypothetical protein
MTRAEDHALSRIDRARTPKPSRPQSPAREALQAAFLAYAKEQGWPEARVWAASRAYFTPASIQADHAAAGHALFAPTGERVP